MRLPSLPVWVEWIEVNSKLDVGFFPRVSTRLGRVD